MRNSRTSVLLFFAAIDLKSRGGWWFVFRTLQYMIPIIGKLVSNAHPRPFEKQADIVLRYMCPKRHVSAV
jgi:hypothetical protein